MCAKVLAGSFQSYQYWEKWLRKKEKLGFATNYTNGHELNDCSEDGLPKITRIFTDFSGGFKHWQEAQKHWQQTHKLCPVLSKLYTEATKLILLELIMFFDYFERVSWRHEPGRRENGC